MLARSPQLLAIEAKLNSSCDDTVVDARAVCGHSRIKLLIAASVVILIVGCAPLNPEKVLGSCWNVNDLAAGRVAGKGLFFTSMEGLSLQAEGCDDRNGGNSFQLRSTASQAVEKYLQSHTGERSIGFAFHGHITRVQGENLLIIEQVDGLRSAQTPHWLIELERRRLSPD
jgi:hypothetical protein